MLRCSLYKNYSIMVHTENTIIYQTVEVEDFAKQIKSPKVYLVDVRTAEEFKEGHIEGAANIDILSPDFVDIAKQTLPNGKEIAVYCGTGKRSAMAAEKLAEMGYPVLNLDGGLEAWKAAGYTI